METTVKKTANGYEVYLDGRLDTAAAPQVSKDMGVVYDCEDGEILLDCTKLNYISSSGIRIFLSLLKYAKANNVEVIIKGLSIAVKQVLQMTGLLPLFKMVD